VRNYAAATLGNQLIVGREGRLVSLDDPAGYHELGRWPVILDDGMRAAPALARAAATA
jgi:hypothetical protein